MGLCSNKESVENSSVRKVYPHTLSSSIVLTFNYQKIPNKFKRHPQQHKIGLIGLQNLGNTCYINAALQCLSNTQPLSEYFMQKIYLLELNTQNPISSKGEITTQYGLLIQQMWQDKKQHCINPGLVVKTIQKWNPHFIINSQQDSHEFLAFLLDMMHEDLNRVKLKPYIEEKTFQEQPTKQDGSISWSNYLKRNRSIIVDLFQGQSRNMLKCLICNTQSFKFEPFMYLSLSIHSDMELSDCIKEYLQEELLDKDNGWYCPKCKKIQKSKKEIKLWKLPNILVIHLKRFKFTQDQRGKLRQFIKYPIYDLNLTSIAQGDNAIYDLYGIINHQGTLSKGHYTSFCKNYINQKWYCFNDTNVQEIKESEIVQNDAYVLFYYKNCVEEFERQSEVIRGSLRTSQLSIQKQSQLIQNESILINTTTKKKKNSLNVKLINTENDIFTTPQILGHKKSNKKLKLTPIVQKQYSFFQENNLTIT